MSSKLVRMLLGELRSELLAILLLQPERGFYVRELGRLTGRSVGTLHRELGNFVATGLLQRTKEGNQVRYQAVTSCAIYPELSSLLRKTVGFAEVLRRALEPLASRTVLAAVFGSMASGTATPRSDVDVLVVGDATFSEVVIALAPAQETLQREVNPVVLTAAALRAKLRDGDRFLRDVLSGPMILLKGSRDDLGEPSQDR